MQAKPEIPPSNDHVKEYLNYYCGLANSPGFAVLLKGSWGSGKTWFIEQYQEYLDSKKIRTLYISLYGLNSTTDIDDKFFQLLHPIMSSKGMAITGKIVKGLLKGTLKIDLTSDGKDDATWTIGIPDINHSFKPSDVEYTILIFDDLERCKIDLGGLLGYINFFVEHNEMKVILIADEEKLFENEDYSSIKEKLIGKTLSISPSFEDVLASSINENENITIKDFLANNFDVIKDVYQKTDYKNLRTLKHILLDFRRIFQALPERVQNHPAALTDLLKALTAFLIEIRQGKILPEDIEKLMTEYASFLNNKLPYSSDKDDESKNRDDESHLHKIIDTYPFLDMYEVFPSLAWWKRFFDKGVIDSEELELSISSSKYFQDENTPDWMKLWHFSKLSDKDFEELIAKIELDFQNRTSSNIGEINHIVGLFLRFSEAGIYKKSKKDVLDASISYVDDLKNSDRLEPLSSYAPSYVSFHKHFENVPGCYRNLEIQGKNTEEFNEFSRYFVNARREAYVEMMPQKAQELLEFVGDDFSKFRRMICYVSPSVRDDAPTYYEAPILKYIEPSLFVEKVLAMKNEDIRSLFWMLPERYKDDSINKKLVEELEWLKSVQRLVLNEVSHRQGRLSGYCLSLLSQDCISEAIERLSSKKENLQE